MIKSLNVNILYSPYRGLIGTGGIGTGSFFALNGDHTLGREESRSGHFLDRRDYCKLHIITHYIKVLLGPSFETILIGKVGDDPIGHRLLDEMKSTGLDLRYVGASPGDQTLSSICFIYPDGTGGNLTMDDSACNRVDSAYVAEAETDFARLAGCGIALAAPEVPLEARHKLLELGTTYRFLRAASFTSGEICPAMEMGLFNTLDLLAMNLDEAAMISGMASEGVEPLAVIGPARDLLQAHYPTLHLSFTAGKRGSWSWDGQALHHVPAIPVEPVSTAGAGDAHLAGILCGLAVGLTLSQAQELGTLVAALSITSPHTIAPEVDAESLRSFAQRMSVNLQTQVWNMLKE